MKLRLFAAGKTFRSFFVSSKGEGEEEGGGGGGGDGGGGEGVKEKQEGGGGGNLACGTFLMFHRYFASRLPMEFPPSHKVVTG